jgi:hypothetical protein
MNISQRFNKYYHSLLGDVIHSGSIVEVNGSCWSASIDTKTSDIEKIKMFFKMTDVKYPKTHNLEKAKNVFGKNESLRLFRFFGVPLSIKEVTSVCLSDHIRFIDRVCYESGIILDSSDTHRMLKMIEQYEI